MQYLLSLPGIRPQIAFALSLSDIGNGTANQTWSLACSVLPYCGQGANGVVIMTGIVINAVLWAIGSAAAVVILYAAIRLITSAGNDETVRKAWKEIIFYACLGLLFSILADTILNYLIAEVGSIAGS